LTLSNNVLYGSTSDWFPFVGTIFKIKTDGSDFKTIHKFDSMGVSFWNLSLVGNTVYGMTMAATANAGSVFSVSTDGTHFATLHSFSNGLPHNDFATTVLVFLDNALYGISTSGGEYDTGTVFRITLPSTPGPQLVITPASNNLVISWPATSAGVLLQSTTNLASEVWTTNLPAPVVINGQNTVTNPISGTQQFFRLTSSDAVCLGVL
jgi:uncharacterized repeat protein (TIGR03803 family)